MIEFVKSDQLQSMKGIEENVGKKDNRKSGS
jgi:hypothetical protein